MAITIQGNDLQLYVGDAANSSRLPLGHAQTVSLDFSNSLIDVTTKSSGAWAENISGQRSFTISADALIDDFGTTSSSDNTPVVLGGYAIAGTLLGFQFGVGNARYEGSFRIDSFSQTGGTDDAPTYSISGTGSGALTYDADITQ